MIKCIKNKISEQRGASLAMALFALIVVTVVSVIMLNSALSNIGRVKRNQQAEQNYLTVSSAAKLMEECLVGISINYNKIEYNDETVSTENLDFKDKYTKAGRDNPFKAELIDWFNNNMNSAAPLGGSNGTGGSNGINYIIKADDAASNGVLEDVLVTVRLSGVENANGTGFLGIRENEGEIGTTQINMTVDLSLHKSAGSENYKMNITLPFTCTCSVTETTEERTKEVDGVTKPDTVIITTTECSFISGKNAKILRGAS